MSDITRDYSFGGWLRQHRVEHDITLRDFAGLVEMDVGNLSKLERSELDPPSSYKSVEKILKPFNFHENQIEFMASLAFSFHLGKLKQKFKE